ncbi:TPA: hypothetical protein TXY98_000535 [Streptococcus suis]|nr:hypothetical protein [Streptococcus suis]
MMFSKIFCRLFGHMFRFNVPEQHELILTCVRCGYVKTIIE